MIELIHLLESVSDELFESWLANWTQREAHHPAQMWDHPILFCCSIKGPIVGENCEGCTVSDEKVLFWRPCHSREVTSFGMPFASDALEMSDFRVFQ